jgi:hypothetical protein
LNNQIREHVKQLLYGLDKGTLVIRGEDKIMIVVDNERKGTIEEGKKSIANLGYGEHKISFSKPGFWDLDTSIVFKQSYQEYPVKLNPIRLTMALGLPYPQRNFTIDIESKSRKNYRLNFAKGRFDDFDDPNIYADNYNVIHFNSDINGAYIFRFYSAGRKSYEKVYPIDGKSNQFHQINFEKPTFSEILEPMNLLLPGKLQMELGYKSMGRLFSISSVAALLYSAYSHNESTKYLDEYKDAKVVYEALQDADQAIMDQHRLVAEDKYNLYSKFRNHSLISNSTFLGLSAASFLHVTWVIRF